MDRRTLLGAGLGLTLAGTARAQDWDHPAPAATAADRPAWPPAEHFDLWPGAAPGAPDTLPVPHNTMNGITGNRELWLYGVPRPYVAVYRPRYPNGHGLVAFPGGGYGFLSVQNEGMDVARTFTAMGYTMFLLVYRLPGEGWSTRWDVPLQDAQRAMRLIRSRAATWKIDTETIGIVGFSAGGHLAASLTVGHDDHVYDCVDAADQCSAKPRFAGLIYPVIDISLTPNGKTTHNLLGDNPPAEARRRYETSQRVTPETPPMFLVHALDDDLVDPGNTLNMLAAARKAEVPVEAHLFETGGHGFGPAHLARDLPGSRWPDLFALWMAKHLEQA